MRIVENMCIYRKVFFLPLWAVICFYGCITVQGENAMEARALVYGVLNARNSLTEFDIRFDYQQEHYPKMQCRLEALGKKRRLEIFEGKDIRREVTLIDDKYVWHYQMGEGADLVQMNIQQASNDGLFCFDPRVIGLTEHCRIEHDPSNMLVEGVQKFEFVGNEKIGEASVSRVRIHRDGRV